MQKNHPLFFFSRVKDKAKFANGRLMHPHARWVKEMNLWGWVVASQTWERKEGKCQGGSISLTSLRTLCGGLHTWFLIVWQELTSQFLLFGNYNLEKNYTSPVFMINNACICAALGNSLSKTQDRKNKNNILIKKTWHWASCGSDQFQGWGKEIQEDPGTSFDATKQRNAWKKVVGTPTWHRSHNPKGHMLKQFIKKIIVHV